MIMTDKPKGFWASIPGILTGLAAVITAMTGLFLAVNNNSPSKNTSFSSAEVVESSSSQISKCAYSEQLYFIDAHSQVGQDIELENIVGLMREAGVKKTILAARGKRKSNEIVELAETYPEQIVAAVRTKSKHYQRNTDKYYKKLSKQLNSGRFNAMAELLLYHAQRGELAEEVVIYPDDERVMAAFEGARENGWPFVLHIEFASLSGSQRAKYFTLLDSFLKQHSEHPIALIHMGQLDVTEVKNLINKHTNIYFLTSHSNPIAARSKQPWMNMFKHDVLTPEWETLIVANPERFIFALDNVWPAQWRNGYKEQVLLWREALSQLPPDVADAVAHGNAESLWKLK